MPLPVPSAWDLRANGSEWDLVIQGVDSNGNATGWIRWGLPGQTNISNASWSESAQALTFDLPFDDGVQHWTGFLFNAVGTPQDSYQFAMAGTSVDERFPPRVTFGWFALGWMSG
jgi:hypothetical protein